MPSGVPPSLRQSLQALMRPFTPASAILFCDFDGPLVDVADRYYATYCQGLSDTQVHFATTDGLLPVHRLNREQFWRLKTNRVPDPKIAACSGLQGEAVVWFLARVREIVNEPALLAHDRLQPSARQALRLLRSHGIQVVIVTLRQSTQVAEFLRRHQLDWAIREIYGAVDSQAAYANHADHKIRRLRDAIADQGRQGQSLNTAWMVGDTEADILAGQAAQLTTIGLTCGVRNRLYLQKFQPDHLHQDLWSAARWVSRCHQQAVPTNKSLRYSLPQSLS
ncbi:HAD family hydrolase [Halomicronema hongdechloris C2206]|uniref:HAD family hydrolase n=1 Tax=Halomicronema hongdechloris C2206 TaxID=1641165 RepID=A0A1Z3HFQ4_9CYAN|nr:HAD family hydrolase [Halomicronema hongdechloris]ASC69107.1 HAD family hydrolase [Halomicronema hongdechloris C2206]